MKKKIRSTIFDAKLFTKNVGMHVCKRLQFFVEYYHIFHDMFSTSCWSHDAVFSRIKWVQWNCTCHSWTVLPFKVRAYKLLSEEKFRQSQFEKNIVQFVFYQIKFRCRIVSTLSFIFSFDFCIVMYRKVHENAQIILKVSEVFKIIEISYWIMNNHILHWMSAKVLENNIVRNKGTVTWRRKQW